jgi:hypothetical protein
MNVSFKWARVLRIECPTHGARCGVPFAWSRRLTPNNCCIKIQHFLYTAIGLFLSHGLLIRLKSPTICQSLSSDIWALWNQLSNCCFPSDIHGAYTLFSIHDAPKKWGKFQTHAIIFLEHMLYNESWAFPYYYFSSRWPHKWNKFKTVKVRLTKVS